MLDSDSLSIRIRRRPLRDSISPQGIRSWAFCDAPECMTRLATVEGLIYCVDSDSAEETVGLACCADHARTVADRHVERMRAAWECGTCGGGLSTCPDCGDY